MLLRVIVDLVLRVEVRLWGREVNWLDDLYNLRLLDCLCFDLLSFSLQFLSFLVQLSCPNFILFHSVLNAKFDDSNDRRKDGETNDDDEEKNRCPDPISDIN